MGTEKADGIRRGAAIVKVSAKIENLRWQREAWGVRHLSPFGKTGIVTLLWTPSPWTIRGTYPAIADADLPPGMFSSVAFSTAPLRGQIDTPLLFVSRDFARQWCAARKEAKPGSRWVFAPVKVVGIVRARPQREKAR